MIKNIVVIGAGPTGLFVSSLLIKEGFSVDLYDQKKEPGRKLLLAGKSGLNITNNLPFNLFITAYGCHQKQIGPSIKLFSPEDLRIWLKDLGIETFVGSSGLVFPVLSGSKELLKLWIKSLNSTKNFNFHPEHQLININKETIQFKTVDGIIDVDAPLAVMGIGGASYPSTGSDGQWVNIFTKLDIKIKPFRPINCGFECVWSAYYKNNTNYIALKDVKLTHKTQSTRGDIVITPYGVEGGPVYKLSREIRDSLEKKQETTVYIDLTPDLSLEKIIKRLNHKRGKNSLSNHLRKQLNLSQMKISILRELTENKIFEDYSLLALQLKKLPLSLNRPRPIEEAISSSGGVSFTELDDFFMLKKYPGWFLAGEMIDWDAPTGGYLLQACFSTSYMAVEGLKNYNP